MRGTSAFKRSNNQRQELDLNYLSRMQIKKAEAKKGVSQNGNRVQNCCNNRGKTANKRSDSKLKIQKPQSSKQAFREKKEPVYNEFQNFEAIINSSCYNLLSRQYAILKREADQISKKAKQQIMDLNREMSQEEIKLAALINLRQSLTAQVNYLGDIYEEVRLKNYQLKCELYRNRGYGESNYYQSQREIEFSELDYEDMLELREQFGVVEIGFDDQSIKKMTGKEYSSQGQPQKCCICCDDLKQGDRVYWTVCGHVHHLQCFGRWLKVKRECPLCRGQIVSL